MTPPPRKLDLLAAALRARGATDLDIAEYTLLLQSRLGRGFRQWNSRLPPALRPTLHKLLSPGGADLAAEIIFGLTDLLCSDAGLSPGELTQLAAQLSRERHGGLS